MKTCLSKYFILLLLIAILSPLTVEAVTIDNPLKADTFAKLIDAIINIIFMLAIAIAPIMFIVAGFYFVTAAGEPEKINMAKKMILWTLIGLLVVMSAKGIIALFGEMFGVETPYNK